MTKLKCKQGVITLEQKSTNIFSMVGEATLSRQDARNLIGVIRAALDEEEIQVAGYTVTEAVTKLGINATAVRNALTEGRLTGTKNSAGWIIDQASVDSYRSRTRRRGGHA